MPYERCLGGSSNKELVGEVTFAETTEHGRLAISNSRGYLRRNDNRPSPGHRVKPDCNLHPRKGGTHICVFVCELGCSENGSDLHETRWRFLGSKPIPTIYYMSEGCGLLSPSIELLAFACRQLRPNSPVGLIYCNIFFLKRSKRAEVSEQRALPQHF